MSMTREEAIAYFEVRGNYNPHDGTNREAEKLALTALRSPTRETVERMRGCTDCKRKTCVSCRRFGWVPQRCIDCNDQDKWSPWNFCPACGRPLTDMGVDMVLERWKEAVQDG